MTNKLVKPNSSIQTKGYGLFSVIFAVCLLAAFPARAGVTVYELFTARDCPSCPRADELFGQIVRGHPDVIALACHVTYFDRPGRADQMSAPFCDGRQEGYKMSSVLQKIYTPAAIVNGDKAIKGNDTESVSAGLSAARVNDVQSIRLTEQGGYLNITLPSVEMSGVADVWLFAYNNGRAVTHLTKLMSWNGKSVAMAFPVQSIPATGYAVIAQTSNQTRIVAAGKTN